MYCKRKQFLNKQPEIIVVHDTHTNTQKVSSKYNLSSTMLCSVIFFVDQMLCVVVVVVVYREKESKIKSALPSTIFLYVMEGTIITNIVR